MGVWGVKLYDDDVAKDVKEDYIELLKYEDTNEIATQELIKEYHYIVDDINDGPKFWFALADTQWKFGRLLSFVKEKVIDNVTIDLERWKEERPKDYKKREKVLNGLLDKLNLPMPELKKINKLTYIKNNWKIGDTFAYKIKINYCYDDRHETLNVKYIILIKVDEYKQKKGSSYEVFPIVYIKITEEDQLSNGLDKIDNYEYIKYWNDRYNLLCNRHIFIYEEKDIKKFIYLGNFDLRQPEDDIIIEDKNNYSRYYLNDNSIYHYYFRYHLNKNK